MEYTNGPNVAGNSPGESASKSAEKLGRGIVSTKEADDSSMNSPWAGVENSWVVRSKEAKTSAVANATETRISRSRENKWEGTAESKATSNVVGDHSVSPSNSRPRPEVSPAATSTSAPPKSSWSDGANWSPNKSTKSPADRNSATAS